MSCKQKKEIICNNQHEIYNLGLQTGLDAGGYTEGFEAGKNAEQNTFWDNYTSNGTRENYSYAFYGSGWNNISFRPTKDIVVVGGTDNMFYGVKITDLQACLDVHGVKLDFSQATGFTYTFRTASLTRVGEIDTREASTISNMFRDARGLVTIDKVIFKDDGSQTFSNVFTNVNSLENITVEGVIGQNGFNISPSTKLTKASITSIINALSPTTSGLTVTLSKTAVNKAFETSEGTNDGDTSEEWTTLVNTKPNWTISLV